jgi:hypothetical protein
VSDTHTTRTHNVFCGCWWWICGSLFAFVSFSLGRGVKMRVALSDRCALFFALESEKRGGYLVLFGCVIYFGCRRGF